MVSGMTSGLTIIINHIFVKILIMIDKYIPFVLTLNNQVNIYMSKRLSMNCSCGIYMSLGVNTYFWTNDVTTSDIISIFPILNISRVKLGLTALYVLC